MAVEIGAGDQFLDIDPRFHRAPFRIHPHSLHLRSQPSAILPPPIISFPSHDLLRQTYRSNCHWSLGRIEEAVIIFGESENAYTVQTRERILIYSRSIK